MSGRQRIAAAVASVVWLVAADGGCGGAPPHGAKPAVPGQQEAVARSGARYVAIDDGSWIERLEDGTDLLVVGGGRLAMKDRAVLSVGSRLPFIDEGIAMPEWARTPGGRFRYVFWNDDKVYGAKEFTGELTPIATLPGRTRGAHPWLDGVALSVGGGLAIVNDQGVVRRPTAHGAATGLAADGSRAVVQTLLGSTLLTRDGGSTFRDVTQSLGDVTSFARVGDDLALRLSDGGRRYVVPSGELELVRGSTGPRKDSRPVEDGGEWPRQEDDPYSLAVTSGVRLSSDTALIVGRHHYAQLDLVSGVVRNVVELPSDRGDCEPLEISGEPLLICVTPARASVYALRGEPVLERSFPLAQHGGRSWQDDKDRFAAVPGEALGFVGPCEGEPEAALPDVTSGASSRRRSRQYSRQFCVRAEAGEWISHELSASDAEAVVAWIPRRHGGAAVIIGLGGTFLGPEVPVETVGGLLIVRVAVEAPPLEMPPGIYQSPLMVSTRLRVAPDGAVEGWLSSSNDVDSRSSVRIDRAGRVVQQPMPSDVIEIRSAGRFAIGLTDAGELFESVDWGAEWHRVQPPPVHLDRFVGECSTVGCLFRGAVRVGWDGRSTVDPPDAGGPRPTRRGNTPPYEAQPLVRLACSFDGFPESRRIGKSYAFGVTAQAIARREGPSEVGKVGWVWAPRSNSLSGALTGTIDAAWLRPLDVRAVIHRSTLPLSGLGATRSSLWLRVGYALRADGTLDPFVTSARKECAAPLFARLGMLSPMGGCHADSSVGVEVAGQVLIASGASGELRVTAVKPDAAATESQDERSALVSRRWGYLPDRKLAMGRRGDQAFLASFDAYGDAVAAPLDLERGQLGPERPLAGLSTLALADAASCRGRDPDDARYVVVLGPEVGLSRSLFGLTVKDGGVAVIRWSERRACLEGIELNIRDQHLMDGLGSWIPGGTTNKLIGLFGGGKTQASAVYIGGGVEHRQALSCTGVAQ